MASINVAYNKPATASSYVVPYSAGRAVDGITSPANRWLCITVPCWLSVNLQGIYWINKWVVSSLQTAGWQSDCNLQDYSLQISMDNANWVTVDTVTGNIASFTSRSITPVQANYVRLLVNRGIQANPTLASILELQVFNIDPTSNYLSGLALNNGTVALSPSFVKTTNSYTATVPYDTSSVTVTPTAEDPNASVKVNGTVVPKGQASAAIPLNVGSNTITVLVTPVVGLPYTYTVNVTRQDSVNLSTMVVKDNNSVAVNINPSFTPGNTAYTANVGFDVTSVTITPTAQSANAAITVNGQSVVSGQASNAITVNVNTNNINIVVSTPGCTPKTYTVVVTKSSNPYLSLLQMSGVRSLTPPFAKNTYSYSATVSSSSVTVTPTAEDATTVIKVNTVVVASGQPSQAIPLSLGSNNVIVETKSAIGSDGKTYTITVTRV